MQEPELANRPYSKLKLKYQAGMHAPVVRLLTGAGTYSIKHRLMHIKSAIAVDRLNTTCSSSFRLPVDSQILLLLLNLSQCNLSGCMHCASINDRRYAATQVRSRRRGGDKATAARLYVLPASPTQLWVRRRHTFRF
jgi:hypothetical protein